MAPSTCAKMDTYSSEIRRTHEPYPHRKLGKALLFWVWTLGVNQYNDTGS
jgi:hypothetical protein